MLNGIRPETEEEKEARRKQKKREKKKRQKENRKRKRSEEDSISTLDQKPRLWNLEEWATTEFRYN